MECSLVQPGDILILLKILPNVLPKILHWPPIAWIYTTFPFHPTFSLHIEYHHSTNIASSMAAEFPPLAALPKLTLHESIDRNKVDVSKIVDDWLSSLSQRFTQCRLTNLSDLFIEESWWRDLVALSWDFTSKHGPEDISKYLGASVAGFGQLKTIQPGALQPQLVDMGGMMYIQSGFSFQTKVGSGRGLVRLANVGPEEWKAWTVLTQLERLTGQDELEMLKVKESETQAGVSNVVNGDLKPRTEDLQVLVVGAGSPAQPVHL